MMGLAGIAQGEAAKRGAFSANRDIEVRYDRAGWLFISLPMRSRGIFHARLGRDHNFAYPLAASPSAWGDNRLVFIGKMIILNENALLYREAQLEIAERRKAEEEVKRLNEDLRRG